MDEGFDDAALVLLARYDIRRDVARIAEVLADGGEAEEEEDDPEP